MSHSLLLLGSSSASRQKLLQEAHIPYSVVPQNADETRCDWGLPLQKLVESIARLKMEHVILPTSSEGQICYVLTADTLSQDMQGTIHGKPTSREDARTKLIQARSGMVTGTAFVLDKKVYTAGVWVTQARRERFVAARYQFNVPDSWLERYLEVSWALQATGAIAIEGYGGLFLENVQGSYTAIVGLPLYELREALQELGFIF